MSAGKPVFSWKVNSPTGMAARVKQQCNLPIGLDLGAVNFVSIRTPNGYYSDGFICTSFLEIRVIDLHDTVYVTSFSQPRFWFLEVFYPATFAPYFHYFNLNFANVIVKDIAE